MLPNFLVIGAVKAGTTSLYRYLSAHPQVFMSATKELNFFIQEENWNRGLAWYEKQFEGGEKTLALGEATPHYTMHPVYSGVPERIARHIPEARLIYVVRHPIDRMRSHYLQRVVNGHKEAPIEEALRDNPLFLCASRYATQIERYLEYFAREKLLVVTAEQLGAHREQTLRRIFAFLGVDPEWTAPIIQREFNRTANKQIRRAVFRRMANLPAYHRLAALAPPGIRKLIRPLTSRRVEDVAVISQSLERHLTEQLRDEVKRLYPYLDDSFDGWGLEKK